MGGEGKEGFGGPGGRELGDVGLVRHCRRGGGFGYFFFFSSCYCFFCIARIVLLHLIEADSAT